MQTQDPQHQVSIQLSLFDYSLTETDPEDNIDSLFTENDLIRFGKGRKGWYENVIIF